MNIFRHTRHTGHVQYAIETSNDIGIRPASGACFAFLCQNGVVGWLWDMTELFVYLIYLVGQFYSVRGPEGPHGEH